MTRYLVGIFFCLILSLLYPAFRYEIFEELRARHIRKRDIRQRQKGALNFWFYTALEKEYGLGKFGVLLRLYPIVAGIFTALHIPFGWIDELAVFDLILATLTALYLSAIILAACLGRNRRLFGSAWIMMESKESKMPVKKDKILTPKSKNGNYIDTYSSFFDLILAALPLVAPVMMGLFEYSSI